MHYSRWKKSLLLATVLLFCVTSVLPVYAYASDGEALGSILIPDGQLSMSEAGSKETILGNLTADAVRAATGVDIALVNCGDFDISSRLRHGSVTQEKILGMFSANREIAIVTIDIEQLVAILEHSVSRIVVDMETETIDRTESDFEGFLSVSGISFIYDASALSGQRLMYLYDSEGQELDLEHFSGTFTVAATGYMLEGGYGYPEISGSEYTGITLADSVSVFWASRAEALDSYDTDRIKSIGTLDDPLISYVPIWGVALAALIFTLIGLVTPKLRPD